MVDKNFHLNNKKKIYIGIIIICILIVAAIFRLIGINTEEVMSDEGNYALRGIGWNDFMQSTTFTTPWNWFMYSDRLPFWTNLSFNDHPPLHFASIWLSSHIFGIHLWAVRFPGVVLSIVSVFLVMLILLRYKFYNGALFAGLFLAILPWHIYISRRAIQEPLVIFWLLLSVYVLICIIQNEEKKIYQWILLGLVLGLGVLTKYSMAVIFPLVAYYGIARKWYKKNNFYLTPIIFCITVAPVIIYNIYTYQIRHHFDLQISRFLKMDTTVDWPASYQGLWQGSPNSVFEYFKNLSSWISIIAVIIIVFGLVIILKNKIFKENKDIFIISYAMSLLVSIFSILTLGDFGRSSIIIPFVALSFGFSSEMIMRYKRNLAYALIVGCLALLSIISVCDRAGIKIMLPNIVSSFYEEPHGFYYWEKWQKENLRVGLEPIHFSSFMQWMKRYVNLINNTNASIIIYDPRIIWFGANWYFYRYSYYANAVPVIHPSILTILLNNKAVKLRGKDIYFIQMDEASKDVRPNLDFINKRLFDSMEKMAQDQKIVPIIIKNDNNINLVKIWRFSWDDSLVVPSE